MKKRYLRLIPTAIFVALFVYFYISNPESWQKLAEVGIIFCIFALLYQLIILFITDLFTKTLVERAGTKLNFVEGYYTAFLSSFGNYFLPLSGGVLLRGLYLKRQHNFSYKEFISISYGSYIISLAVSSFLGIIALVVLYLMKGLFVPSLFLIFIFILATMIVLSTKLNRIVLGIFARPLNKNKYTRKVIAVIQKISEGWLEIVATPGLAMRLIGLTLINMALRLGFFFLAFKAVGTSASLASVFILNILITLSTYLTLTPGSLGIREALLLIYSEGLGISTEAILAVNIIDRASIVVALTLLYIVFQSSRKYRSGRVFSRR